MSMYEVSQQELVNKLAEELKKVDAIKAPEWAIFVKTGVQKERPPLKDDWWYQRTASVLRLVAKMNLIGVGKLRTKYGGKKSRGYGSEARKEASGNIIRKVLQQLEAAGFVEKSQKGTHKGRKITKKGVEFINNAVKQIQK